MNITAYSHIIAGLIIVVLCIPLIRRKIRKNKFYGIRSRRAFESERLWYEINSFGGRIFLLWGIAVILTGLVGISLPKALWLFYQWIALFIILGGLLLVVVAIRYHTDKIQ